MSLDNSNGAKQTKKLRERPCIQIYRPPGLRISSTSQTVSSKSQISKTEKESDRVSNASSESRSSVQSDKPKISKQKESSSRPIQAKEPKKKAFSGKEFDDIVAFFQKLDLSKEQGLVDDFIGSSMESVELAQSLGLFLARHAIEENKQNQRIVARLCASLMECPTGVAFHKGLLASFLQYFECRDQLRSTHIRVWIGFLNFVSDIYSNVDFTYEGGLVEIIFNIFDYMLKQPVLDTLKIEELECLIASLLSVGYDLERNCPDQLGQLKDCIRDAFVEVNEPWARKMILLLMELSASGWSLPPEANEYYFQ